MITLCPLEHTVNRPLGRFNATQPIRSFPPPPVVVLNDFSRSKRTDRRTTICDSIV